MPSVSDFVATAGASLVDAQSGLVEEGTIARMAVSEARLEAKVALNSTPGDLQLETVSLGDITSGLKERLTEDPAGTVNDLLDLFGRKKKKKKDKDG